MSPLPENTQFIQWLSSKFTFHGFAFGALSPNTPWKKLWTCGFKIDKTSTSPAACPLRTFEIKTHMQHDNRIHRLMKWHHHCVGRIFHIQAMFISQGKHATSRRKQKEPTLKGTISTLTMLNGRMWLTASNLGASLVLLSTSFPGFHRSFVRVLRLFKLKCPTFIEGFHFVYRVIWMKSKYEYNLSQVNPTFSWQDEVAVGALFFGTYLHLHRYQKLFF